MDSVLSWVMGLSGPWLYTAATLFIFCESIMFMGMIFPGDTTALVAGAAAGAGKLNLAVLMPLIMIAAVAGDTVAYAIGRFFGPGLHRTWVGRTIGDEHWEQAHERLTRNALWTIIACRWTPVLRALVPTVAGIVQVPYRTFVVANVIGGVTWGAFITLVGYFAGQSLQRAKEMVGSATVVMVIVIVLIVVFLGVRHLLRQRAASS